MFKLQQFVFPQKQLVFPPTMYARNREDQWGGYISNIHMDGRNLKIHPEEEVHFDSFFNGFFIETWKANTQIHDLGFCLKGLGDLTLTLSWVRFTDKSIPWHKRPPMGTQVLHTVRISISDKGFFLPIPSWKNLEDGMLWVSVKAHGEVTITDGYFYTHTAPCQDVKLGLVVTHFNRKQFLIPAIKRVTEQLLNDYQDKISMVVVDNSQNILPEESGKAIVIPNKNLGGSGGFTRGLIYLKDHGYTHCLFMDDDASCEIESIRRTYALYSYAKPEDRIAVSGTLILEDRADRVYEKGGIYEGGACHPAKLGVCLSAQRGLLEAEGTEPAVNYGAWCFYAFAVNHVRNYSFPFFVRGDDILFGLQNAFRTVTMNGVATLIDSFAEKESPMTTYLHFRAESVINMIHENKGVLDLIRKFNSRYLMHLFAYQYATVEAMRLGLQAVLDGPETFEKDVDAKKVRSRIGAIAGLEKMIPINSSEFIEEKDETETRWQRFFRSITLNGLLVPKTFFKNGIVYQPKGIGCSKKQVFRYRYVGYVLKKQGIGYVTRHSKNQLLYGLVDLIRWDLKILLKLPSIKKQFKEKMNHLTSDKFWRNEF